MWWSQREKKHTITVKSIIKGAKLGKFGDGKIFIMEMLDCIRIRTEESGEEAIG